jgi:hypothetical protein
VVADPGVRTALPFYSRVSSVSVSASLAGGDVGQNFVSATFVNNGFSNEVVAFEFACAVPV